MCCSNVTSAEALLAVLVLSLLRIGEQAAWELGRTIVVRVLDLSLNDLRVNKTTKTLVYDVIMHITHGRTLAQLRRMRLCVRRQQTWP